MTLLLLLEFASLHGCTLVTLPTHLSALPSVWLPFDLTVRNIGPLAPPCSLLDMCVHHGYDTVAVIVSRVFEIVLFLCFVLSSSFTSLDSLRGAFHLRTSSATGS